MAVYVVHQPIVVAVAHVVVPLAIPALAKFLLVVLASAVLVAAAVALLRLIPVTRVVLGLPWGDRPAAGR